MKYLETILSFLTTIARMLFRGKGKHKPGCHPADGSRDTGSPPKEYGSSPGGYRSDSLDLRETYPTPEKIMGGYTDCLCNGKLPVKIIRDINRTPKNEDVSIFTSSFHMSNDSQFFTDGIIELVIHLTPLD